VHRCQYLHNVRSSAAWRQWYTRDWTCLASLLEVFSLVALASRCCTCVVSWAEMFRVGQPRALVCSLTSTILASSPNLALQKRGTRICQTSGERPYRGEMYAVQTGRQVGQYHVFAHSATLQKQTDVAMQPCQPTPVRHPSNSTIEPCNPTQIKYR
jgi:hypothetical protein